MTIENGNLLTLYNMLNRRKSFMSRQNENIFGKSKRQMLESQTTVNAIKYSWRREVRGDLRTDKGQRNYAFETRINIKVRMETPALSLTYGSFQPNDFCLKDFYPPEISSKGTINCGRRSLSLQLRVVLHCLYPSTKLSILTVKTRLRGCGRRRSLIPSRACSYTLSYIVRTLPQSSVYTIIDGEDTTERLWAEEKFNTVKSLQLYAVLHCPYPSTKLSIYHY
ncbi:hypothetical protein J6590_051809 [Homalodisca vitripennis]|nr:hypothetical protein J6590_051809 [Homalodisca vitripennis]